MGPDLFAQMHNHYFKDQEETKDWLECKLRAFFEMRDFSIFKAENDGSNRPQKWIMEFRVYTWKNFHLNKIKFIIFDFFKYRSRSIYMEGDPKVVPR